MSEVQAVQPEALAEAPTQVEQPEWVANAQPPQAPAEPTPPTVAAEVEKAATDAVETGAIDAVETAVEVVHTHGTILAGLMKDLEGMAHMAKVEVEAVVARARSLFEAL